MTKLKIFLVLLFVSLFTISITSIQFGKSFCGVTVDHRVAISKQKIVYSQKIVNPHGIRIKYLQPAPDVKFDLAQLKKMLGISAFFFKQLLTVSDVSMDTKFNQGQCGAIKSTTSPYATNGFDTKQADVIVSTVAYIDQQTTTLAFAGACQLGPWPIYGSINFNYGKFNADPTKTAQFQFNLMTLLHQQTHIFAFSGLYFKYGLFKVAYLSSQYIPSCQTVAQYNNRWFLITPNVKAWVQRHYGCNSSQIGGLLADSEQPDYPGSHWDKTITFDEYMNAFTTPGFKVTPLTLNLFKDTGFYYNVDFSLANDMKFGKNKGCNFALGLQTSSKASPEYCSPATSSNTNTYLLDFYNLAYGYCDSISSNINIVQAYSNTVCNDENNAQQGLNTFGANSRSFMVSVKSRSGSKNQPRCLQSKCSNGGSTITITVSGKTGTCTNGGASTVTISDITVYCPSNFYIFCNQQDCLNHCGGQGFCSQGSCLSETLCTSISSDCVRCKDNKCTGCKLGLFPTGNSKPACDTCQKVMPSCKSGCEVNHTGVTICKQFFPVSPITGTCPECSAVKFCQTCQSLKGGQTSCLKCSRDQNGNERFTSSDKKKCLSCSQVIPGCVQCYQFQSSAMCKSCMSGYSQTRNYSCQKNKSHLKQNEGLDSFLDLI